MSTASIFKLHDADNVAIAVQDLQPDTPLDANGLHSRGFVPRGHKVAVCAIGQDQPVLKYHQIIGFATRPIAAGEHVHTHNLAFRAFERDHAVGADVRPVAPPTGATAHFDGIVRADGRVGTRNYIGVLTSVNCSATVARYISDHFRAPGALAHYPAVDGVVALTHGSGCGMASEGEGMDLLRRTLAGYIRHPNFAGVLVVGLGCEANQIPRLLEAEGLAPGDNLHTLVMQETGGTAATVRAGVERVQALLEQANRVSRQSVPASHLSLALQCGGSDAYSGITANPALGAAADLLVRHGGTAILGETPEIYGAEHLLTRRAVEPAVAGRLLELIHWWEDYTARNGGSMDNNPSPGNKEGGLTTILEKSLGAVAKGGTSNLVEVVRYAEIPTRKGFVFMDSPGYDPVSVTGQVAGGSNIVCFTTGRGSCYGCKPAPSLKLATNTTMYQRMSEDMDINCGEILDGTASVAAMGERIFQRILQVASGARTKSEELGYGEDEFTPWQLGAVM